MPMHSNVRSRLVCRCVAAMLGLSAHAAGSQLLDFGTGAPEPGTGQAALALAATLTEQADDIGQGRHAGEISSVDAARIAVRSAQLKTLFAGVSISFSRGNSMSGEWTFGRGGRLSGTMVQEEMNEDITYNVSGKWWVEGGRLCVQGRARDGGKAYCDRITGKGRRYRAAGAGGMLRGDFLLDRARN